MSRPPQTWDTLLRMPTLLWLCQSQHPLGYRETISPIGWRRLALDAEVGRYMPGVRR